MSRIVLASFDAYFHHLDPMSRIMITDYKPVEKIKKQIVETSNGIYARQMGGLIDTDEETREFCCDCKALKGRFYAGQICPTCNTVVKDQFFADITKFGWIDIYPFYVIQPNAYMLISKVIGATSLNRIIKYEMNLDANGLAIKKVPTKSNPFDGIGLIEFKKKFNTILLHYASKAKDTNKIKIAKLLISQKNRVFCSKIPVINSLLRTTFTSNKRSGIKPDDINRFYISILRNVDIIKRNYNRISRISILNNLYSIQTNFVDLYNKITKDKLRGKKRLIRGKILGSRLSFTARMVITPLLDDEHFGLNHIVISYKAFLELFNLEILNLIIHDPGTGKFSKMTPYELINYINLAKYSKKVDEDLYDMMIYIINKHEYGLWALINRNPTLALGSTQAMKIVHVIHDALALVLRVPSPMLVSMNGDHDGDALNCYSGKEKRVVKAWVDNFSPSALVVNKTGSSIFNDEYNVYKDIQTGIWAFTTESETYLRIKEDIEKLKKEKTNV